MNKILAMPAAAPAMPVKPSNAAIKAIIKKRIVQDNISTSFFTSQLSVRAIGHMMLIL
jgi:hypothetical protein